MNVRQMFDLSGRVALVTGGSRGLGLQMAYALGEMGGRVAIAARKPAELTDAQAALQAAGIDAASFPCDLQDSPNTAPQLVDAVLERFGTIDILVNNAGATWSAPAEAYPDEAWYKVMRLNVDAPFFLSREVGRRCMIPRQVGKIINLASAAGLRGTAQGVHTIAYNTSKAALINFTRTLACEWGRFGINVNVICPGFFPSRMSAGLLGSIGKQVIARTPLGRLGGDSDLKGAVVFLASEASRHITGQVLPIDGGVSAS
ncbi:MAG: SDR family oxidoreductase [Burkholderiales bacterium]|nr:SDR family oxidoreductase [Burkholderiales bacterium]MBK8664508.1 SDR family oxidoreductase [Burkholderiales bacterium]